MTTASSHLTRRRVRVNDPEEEAETTVFSRPLHYFDRAMVAQITRDLAIPRAPTPAPTPPRTRGPAPAPARAAIIARPNVFLTPRTPADPTPLWEMPPPPALDDERVSTVSGVRKREARSAAPARRRSILPWVAFVMYFGIAFGVGNDPTLRTQLRRELGPVVAVIDTGNRALQHVLAAARASAPRPLPSP